MTNKKIPTIEEQMDAIFGKGSFRAASAPTFAERDAQLAADLASAIGFDSTPYSEAIQTMFQGLTHAQQALVLTDVLAASSKACPVALVINTKSLEGNLGATLAYAAVQAGAPVELLLEASHSNLEDIAHLAVSELA